MEIDREVAISYTTSRDVAPAAGQVADHRARGRGGRSGQPGRVTLPSCCTVTLDCSMHSPRWLGRARRVQRPVSTRSGWLAIMARAGRGRSMFVPDLLNCERIRIRLEWHSRASQACNTDLYSQKVALSDWAAARMAEAAPSRPTS